MVACPSISLRPSRSNGPDDSICFDCVGAERESKGGVKLLAAAVVAVAVFVAVVVYSGAASSSLPCRLCPSIHPSFAHHSSIHPSIHLHGKASKHPRRCFPSRWPLVSEMNGRVMHTFTVVAAILIEPWAKDGPSRRCHWPATAARDTRYLYTCLATYTVCGR
ncbi:hypothetical protein J3F84DRAFT_245608 [Trichoderma pleuroticola]